ncbi:MAG: hypothetical protein Tsb0034_09060 [Ekhidna sp.]
MSECPDCSCSDFDKCLRILNLILDNEASEEQEKFFYEHIEKCMVCFAHYNVERQIRQLLKTKLNQHPVPTALADEIRGKIID